MCPGPRIIMMVQLTEKLNQGMWLLGSFLRMFILGENINHQWKSPNGITMTTEDQKDESEVCFYLRNT